MNRHSALARWTGLLGLLTCLLILGLTSVAVAQDATATPPAEPGATPEGQQGLPQAAGYLFLPLLSNSSTSAPHQDSQVSEVTTALVRGQNPPPLTPKSPAAQDDLSLGQPAPAPGQEPSLANILMGQDIKESVPSDSPVVDPAAADGWATIMSEGFEGMFPSSGWTVSDDNGSSYGEYYWDDDSYMANPGSWSAWAANGGANGLDPRSYNYPNNMNAWMEYGPFDLSNTTDATLSFNYWNRSEASYDFLYWLASVDGQNYYGSRTSGDSGGWKSVTFSLKSVPGLGDLTGRSRVWIAFVFTSDSSVTNKGAFVDNIVLQKNTNSTSGPSGYTFCANENQRCSFSGTMDVAYGANGRFYYRTNVTGGIDCKNSVFGDPSPGVSKACYTKPAASAGGPAGYTFCANENQRCSFSGTMDVAYGANGRFYYRTNITGGIGCDNGVFGDPSPGVSKACYTKASSAPGSCPGQYRAEYFTNRTLTGTPAVVRCENWPINYNWGDGSPVSGIGADNFSVRWTGIPSFNAGTYTFRATADDGVKVWLDNGLIIDAWRDQGATMYESTRQVSAGTHDIKMEYYENGGGAVAALNWSAAAVGSGITYSMRNQFHVFKIDMWNPNLTFETVMADDASSGNTTRVEYVREMVARAPYNSRNPVLAFNADYFGENHHGAEGLTVKNGTRLPNAGTNNGEEWRRSSLSISSSKGVRIGKQTDCVGSASNPRACTSWTPDRDRYYNTVGGGPLFVQDGQRIGGAGSTTPCTNESLPTTYCTGTFMWTAAGVSSDGRYLIVVVSSVGKTMNDAASVLIAEGASRALKFDGGGSTQVWYRPNSSIVGGGRRVTNAIMVFSTQ